MKTLKEIENEHRRLVYGSCSKCNIEFKSSDEFIEMRKFICGSSLGYPETFHTGKETRYCTDCATKYNLYL